MEKGEGSTRNISAALDDLKKFMKAQVDEFKTEAENMLVQMKEDAKKLVASDPAEPAQRQRSPQLVLAEPVIEEQRSDSASGKCILPFDDVIVGSAIDPVSTDFETNMETERGKNELISSDNEAENEEESEDAGLDDGLRKSRRTVKEPAWMKDFMTVKEAEREGFLGLDGAKKSKRTIEKPAWREDSMTVENAESEDHSSVSGSRKSRRTVKEPAWMKDFESGKES